MVYTLKLNWEKDGESSSKELSLDRQITIGRQSENDVALDSTKVSRANAVIFVREDVLMIRNSSEKNAVLVSRGSEWLTLAHKEETTLNLGTQIQIGDVRLNVEASTLPTLNEAMGLMVKCPKCGRMVERDAKECPYDGWSLAGAQSVFINLNE